MASEMFDYLTEGEKDYLGEEEVLKILNIAYKGVRTENDVKLDDIISYINYHGSRE